MKLYLAFAALSNTALFAAQAAEPAGNDFSFLTPFLNVGLVGVLLLMFVFRKGIVPEWVLRQTEERHKLEIEAKDNDIRELKELVRQATELYNTQVVPAFTRSIDVNREYLELLREGANKRSTATKRASRTRGE